MGSVLISYNPQALAVWTGLTNHLKPESFPRTLNPIPGSVSNRFDYDFNTVHSGQTASFLAEFQFPFASWYTNPTNPIPLKHWVHLVQAVYNAGERNMVNNPDLFTSLVETMLAQFELISDGEFNPQSVIGFGAKNLSEDLIDTEIEPLLTKGRAFEAYLPTRGL